MEWFPAFLQEATGITLPAGPSVDDDPVGAWRTQVDAVQALLDDPARPNAEHDLPHIGRMPLGQAIDMIYTGDVFLHRWDLARATGQDETLDPDKCAAMLDAMLPMDDALRQSGHYGPRVEVRDDADVQTKLLAFIGRAPSRVRRTSWPGWASAGTRPEATGVEVVERLLQLGPGVHHERSVGGDGLPDREAAQHQHVERRGALVLLLVGAHGDDVAGAEHRELAGLRRPPVRADRAVPAHDVDEGVEVGRPRQPQVGAGLDGGVDQRDGGVGDPGARRGRRPHRRSPGAGRRRRGW